MNEQYKAVITVDEANDILMETDEEIIKRVSNEFITKEGIGGYTMFVELNNRWRNGEEGTYCFQSLWNRWINKWQPYLLQSKRTKDLAGEITEKACDRYYKRYKKEMI